MVRGYWGDIINSPFIPFGCEVIKEADAKKFFGKINYQRIHDAGDVTEYNISHYLTKLDTLVEYVFPFEKLRRVYGQYDKDEEGNKLEATVEDVKEEDEEEEEKGEPKEMLLEDVMD